MKRWQIIMWALITLYLAVRLIIEGGQKTNAEVLEIQNQHLLQWIENAHGGAQRERLEKWSFELAIDDVQYGRGK